tara:strand:- start:59 stop:847 length:789 start_codon:yes stop_codon:yes gene_type:complete
MGAADKKDPQVPAGLSGEAAKLWPEVKSLLEGNDLLHNPPILAQYLEIYSLYKEALVLVRINGATENGKIGPDQANVNEHQRNMLEILRRFGSDPYVNETSLEDDESLNENQRRFVREFCRLRNGTKAAISAGYSKRGASAKASQLLSKDKIQVHIRQTGRYIARELNVTQELVMAGMLSEAQGQGPDTNSAARGSAWREIAKHMGWYEADNSQKLPLDRALSELDAGQLGALLEQIDNIPEAVAPAGKPRRLQDPPVPGPH